ncbi:MAG: hypothetical protein J6C27_04420 [Clostridia bacterium]|nr:hypothetical protein [Clostridia bacterium]
MNCPRCHSDNVNFQVVSEKQKTGCFMFLLFGIFNLLRPNKTQSYAVCQNCGKSWKVKPFQKVKAISATPTEIVEGNVKLIRHYRTLYKDVAVKITINDQIVKLGNGETKGVELPKGEYQLQVKMYGAKPTSYLLNVDDSPIALTFERKGNKIIIN